MVENSKIVKKVLTTLLNISGRKTSKEHAVMIMGSLLKQLETRYDFLRNIKVKDTRFLENEESVNVLSDVNSISENEVGKAIHDIILMMNNSLGKNAGYFFYKEISKGIDDDYQTTMKNMGVDLGLMQLEREVEEMEKNMYSSKKISNKK
jgi:hypothetical protein